MLPLLIGVVAFASAGYVGAKLATDEEFRDSTKETVSDLAEAGYNKLEKIEESCGLNSYSFEIDDNSKK